MYKPEYSMIEKDVGYKNSFLGLCSEYRFIQNGIDVFLAVAS